MVTPECVRKLDFLYDKIVNGRDGVKFHAPLVTIITWLGHCHRSLTQTTANSHGPPLTQTDHLSLTQATAHSHRPPLTHTGHRSLTQATAHSHMPSLTHTGLNSVTQANKKSHRPMLTHKGHHSLTQATDALSPVSLSTLVTLAVMCLNL